MVYNKDMIKHTIKSGETILLDSDSEELTKLSWQLNSTGYARRTMRVKGNKKYKTLLMHRFIMGEPENMIVDHINGNKLDNRKSNLRVCTQSENLRNQGPRRGTSKYSGVSLKTDKRWSGNYRKWVAQINFNNRHYAKVFDNEVEAARWRDNKLDELGDKHSPRNYKEQGQPLPLENDTQ